jgi:DNA-binding LacI/PurR family transcriptional regulator
MAVESAINPPGNRSPVCLTADNGRTTLDFMARTRTGLKEVAERCAVAPSTVSRVLNNTKHGRFSVSQAVRNRILKVAKELNYHPSVAARNMTVSKTCLIAVLGVSRFEADHVGPLEEAIGAMAKSLDAEGYEICAQFISPRRGPFELPPLRVDGIVAVGPTSLEDLQVLEQSEIPYVSLDGVAGSRGLQVIPDDAQGTRLAIQHLVSLGHKRIAYLDNPSISASHPSVFTRRDAFRRALREFGLETPVVEPPKLPDQVPWDSTYEPFLYRAVIEGKATAVLAYSHFAALSLLRAAHDNGVWVPKDFSLVCFNNAPVLKLTTPSLTAVDVPSGAMGQAAAELLLGAINAVDSAAPRLRRLEEKLIVRESSSSPKPTP